MVEFDYKLIDVECEICGAKTGEQCKNRDGTIRNLYHISRDTIYCE